MGADTTRVAERSGGETVRFRSWGRLRLGMTPQRAWRTGMVSRQRSGCGPGYTMAEPFLERGMTLWRPVRDRRARMRVSAIVVRTETDRTAAGVGVGTTLRELRSTYPRLTRVRPAARLAGEPRQHQDAWVASVGRRGGWINFQFAYGARRPKADSPVEAVVVSRTRRAVIGC